MPTVKEISRRRVTVWMVVLCLAFLVGRTLSGRDGLERLNENPPLGSGSTILRKGQFYFVLQNTLEARRPVQFALCVQTAGESRRRFLMEISDPQLIAETVGFTDDHFYYTTRPNTIQSAGLGGGTLAAPIPRNGPVYLGRFRLEVPPKTLPGEIRKRLPLYPMTPAPPATLHRIALEGGRQETFPDMIPAQSSPVIIREKVYWLHQQPDEIVQVWNAKTYREEVRGRSELRERDLKTGQTRKVVGGLEGGLSSGTERVFWNLSRPYPDKGSDLYSYSPAERKMSRLPACQNYNRPVESDGRLYWIANRAGSSENAEPTSELLCARPDGSERRVLFALPTGYNWPSFGEGNLKRHNGQLYFEYPIPQNPKTPPRSDLPLEPLPCRVALVRLHPERPDPLEPVYQMPDGVRDMFLDGDYLYFTRRETADNWKGWFSLQDRSEVRDTLYRTRLH